MDTSAGGGVESMQLKVWDRPAWQRLRRWKYLYRTEWSAKGMLKWALYLQETGQGRDTVYAHWI